MLDYEPTEAEWAARLQIIEATKVLMALHGERGPSVVEHAFRTALHVTLTPRPRLSPRIRIARR